MADYRIVWEIDATADTPEEAARWAWEIMRKPDSMANSFQVISEDGSETKIDLQEIDDELAAEALETPAPGKPLSLGGIKPPLRMFQFNSPTKHDDWATEFYDTGAKGAKRLWEVYLNPEMRQWEGILRRSETESSSFMDWHVALPKKLAAYLGAMVEQRMESE